MIANRAHHISQQGTTYYPTDLGLQGQHCRKQERNTAGIRKATKKRHLEIKLI